MKNLLALKAAFIKARLHLTLSVMAIQDNVYCGCD